MMDEIITISDKEQIFLHRARTLANEPRRGLAAKPSLSAVVFMLSRETYAVESIYVREVLPFKEVTPLPSTPPFVLGLINVRGQILSLIDLRVLFDLPRQPATAAAKVIVLRAGDMDVGVLAEAVVGACSIPLDEIRPALPTMTGLRERSLRGIAGEALLLLAANKLLSDDAIIVNQQEEGAEQ